jgi:hypothetical protein
MDDKKNRLDDKETVSKKAEELVKKLYDPKNERISTGFPSLDRALNGGVPCVGTLIVLTVDPKCFVEEVFVAQLADQLAGNDMFVWISSSVLTPDEIVKISELRLSREWFERYNIDSFIQRDKTPTYEERLDIGVSQYKCFCDNVLINGCSSSVCIMEDLFFQALELKLRAAKQGKRLFIIIDPLQTLRKRDGDSYDKDPDEIMYEHLIMIRDFAVRHNISIFVINTDPRDRIEMISDVHFTLNLKGCYNGKSYIFKDSEFCITKPVYFEDF